MQLSPLQLKRYTFNNVNISAIEPVEQGSTDNSTSNCEDNVEFKTSLSYGIGAGQEENPKDFAVKLGITVDSAPGCRVPYRIDISITGFFEASEAIALEKRRDIAMVNGASLLLGVIRDQILTLTLKMALGPFLLPTMNFTDHIGQLGQPHGEK